MFKHVDIMCVFLRNRVCRFRKNYPLANFLILLFLAYLSEHSWQIFPSIYSAFSSIKTWTVPPFSFARDVRETVGRWLVVNHKHDDYASTALTLVNVTNTTRLLGGEIERDRLE